MEWDKGVYYGMFNLYACLVAEKWKVRLKDPWPEGVRLYFYHKIDGKTFIIIRSNKGSLQAECQCADYVAILANKQNGLYWHLFMC